MNRNIKVILFCLLSLTIINCKSQPSVSKQTEVKSEYVNAKLMEKEDSMQSLILEEYAKSHGYKAPDYEVFKEKCLQFFGIRLHPSAQVYGLDINEDITYSVNEIGRFIYTGNESLFYQPALDYEPTMDEARKVLYTKENGIADMFLAYNKLLFNDNSSSLSYFYKHKDNAIDIVFDLNYENNDLLTQRAIEYACQNGYIVNDVTNVLFYNNPSRGYRKKLITMFYKYTESGKDRMETFENLVYAYYKHYKQINVKQKVKDECLVCLLDCLNKYDETHQDNILKVMDKKSYQHLSNFMLVDKELIQRMEKNNYYGSTALRDVAKAVLLLSSTTDDFADYYIEDPDGYTNVRTSGNSKAKIITQVKSGSFVDVIEKRGDWWKVKTDNGKVGYIHKSRIRCN